MVSTIVFGWIPYPSSPPVRAGLARGRWQGLSPAANFARLSVMHPLRCLSAPDADPPTPRSLDAACGALTAAHPCSDVPCRTPGTVRPVSQRAGRLSLPRTRRRRARLTRCTEAQLTELV